MVFSIHLALAILAQLCTGYVLLLVSRLSSILVLSIRFPKHCHPSTNLSLPSNICFIPQFTIAALSYFFSFTSFQHTTQAASVKRANITPSFDGLIQHACLDKPVGSDPYYALLVITHSSFRAHLPSSRQ